MVSHHHESDVLLKRTADAFDRLYEELAQSTRVMAIGVHPYVTGAASDRVFRAALRVHQQAARRRALDRPGNLRLVCQARAAAYGFVSLRVLPRRQVALLDNECSARQRCLPSHEDNRE